jgi:hypothetical protein
MGIAGDPFFCPNWEPKTPEQVERLERWLREARENVRIREAAREAEEREREAELDCGSGTLTGVV